jgi:hypothetical protein
VPGVEAVDGTTYTRSLGLAHGDAVVALALDGGPLRTHEMTRVLRLYPEVLAGDRHRLRHVLLRFGRRLHLLFGRVQGDGRPLPAPLRAQLRRHDRGARGNDETGKYSDKH